MRVSTCPLPFDIWPEQDGDPGRSESTLLLDLRARIVRHKGDDSPDGFDRDSSRSARDVAAATTRRLKRKCKARLQGAQELLLHCIRGVIRTLGNRHLGNGVCQPTFEEAVSTLCRSEDARVYAQERLGSMQKFQHGRSARWEIDG